KIDLAAFAAGIRARGRVAAPAPAEPPPVKPARRADQRPLIAIDAGHGGVDPGAIGSRGTYEKKITLAFARELKRQLDATGRFRATLTRERDIFVRLRGRIAIARRAGADLFISLHADSLGSRRPRGASVYTLSNKASDKEAAALAAKENKSDLIAGVDLTHENPVVANILIDLAQRETMNQSARFAKTLIREMGRDMRLMRNTHRFAGFAVLKAPDVPSVLIELGYLSNPTEEKLLNSAAYRKKATGAIVRAIKARFVRTRAAQRN
ncbi:MAG: N-acetylmuramoyl-L-alanine amidase family protein, partial [Alphaproteobacteria bacterium]